MTNYEMTEVLFPAAFFVLSDGGRSDSRRPKQKNDCTVRALALTTKLDYDLAYDHLAARGRKCSRGADFPKNTSNDEALGHTFEWVSLPAVKGERRMNPYKFCLENPEGAFILRTAKHVIAVVNGKIFDDYQPLPNRCVYGYWKVIRRFVVI